ncbi:HlyD family efflux transporter periplasmic adaptor subunit [Paenibacillus pedocola]|uniref:HlyD family efflux transporter periplasmic adaptor subunit n=1 Tax=Paenibacillus pedocola TaxID=3242193 RepID=UPI0028779817|nr:HlyD family efflux transporter periplasmic adaptor subunit [Paenibacillus typhae]
MSGIIHDLSEMSDSREIMESKTNPVISIFIFIVLILLAAAFTWSFFGQMDVVAKASAIVRPNEKVSTIQPAQTGKVEHIYIREGMTVQRGEKLLSFEHKDLDVELAQQHDQLSKLTRKIEYLQRYKQSIHDLHNLFSAGKTEEAYYRDMVEQFLLDYNVQQQSFEATNDQLAAAVHENSGSRETLSATLHASETKSLLDKQELERKENLLNTELTNEKLLEQSIRTGRNLLPVSDSKRTEQYNTYLIKYKQLSNLAAEKKVDYDRSASLGERLMSKSQIDTAQQQYQAAQLQTSQYQQESLLGTQSNITSYAQELKELQVSLDLLNEGKDTPSSEREAIKLQEQQLSGKQEDLNKQQALNLATEKTALEKLKLDRIVQIHASIEAEQKNLTALQENVKQLELGQEKTVLTAPIAGIVNILKDTTIGDMVQAGESLLTIIPTNESKYKMSLAVPNAEAGKISVGDKVDLSFTAFPKQSFGSLRGTITSISTDSIVQQDGLSYYLAEATIPNSPLTNRRGERGELRIGMTANASVITDSKKIIDFILEKINLKD